MKLIIIKITISWNGRKPGAVCQNRDLGWPQYALRSTWRPDHHRLGCTGPRNEQSGVRRGLAWATDLDGGQVGVGLGLGSHLDGGKMESGGAADIDGWGYNGPKGSDVGVEEEIYI